MPADKDAVRRAGGEAPGAAGEGHHDAVWLVLPWRSALDMQPGVSSRMRAELERLRAAFPGFSFGVCRGWRGLAFEAWRDTGAGGLYAVITQDAGELWRELEAGQEGLRPVADARGKQAR